MGSLGIVVKKQNRYIQKFKEVEALSESTAKKLDEVGITYDYVFRGMHKRGIFIGVQGDKYYMSSMKAILS